VVVVDGGLGVKAETHVDRGDTRKVLEGREIRTGAHGGDLFVPYVVDCLTGDGLVGRSD
jgi:hypothetical protein